MQDVLQLEHVTCSPSDTDCVLESYLHFNFLMGREDKLYICWVFL